MNRTRFRSRFLLPLLAVLSLATGVGLPTQAGGCTDVETDGKAVHSDAKLRNGSTKQRAAVDSDGGGNACATSARTVSDIIQHRTCEEKPAWPDDCGNWVGTGA